MRGEKQTWDATRVEISRSRKTGRDFMTVGGRKAMVSRVGGI